MSVVSEKYRLELWCIQGSHFWIDRADTVDYDPAQWVATVTYKSRIPFVSRLFKSVKEEGSTNYVVAPDHMIADNRKSFAFIDVNNRQSLSLKNVLAQKLNSDLQVQLDLMLKGKVLKDHANEQLYPLRYLLIALLGGAGLWAVLRFVASIMGYYIP